jgi:hypothetical protein
MPQRASVITITIWMIALSVLVIGCHTSLTSRRPEPVILEVIDRDWGMVCSTEQHLELRVYASGWTEGDVFTGGCSPRLSRIFSSYRLRSSQLDEGHLEQLKTALNQLYLSTVKDVYPQFVIETDSGVSETINFQIGGTQRGVALVNPRPTDSRNKENYPPALINVLLQITEIRQRFDANVR